jgi:diguanylate cyclase (GGDEF)-like protein
MNDNILLVDDDPAIIQMMAKILATSGTLRFATCGEDALTMARQSPPDLMLLDAEMPGMSGFEVLEALKADAALADVPVIFVTSHCEATFEVAGLDLGAADFIAKPFSAPLVLARVRAQLRAKHRADELRLTVNTDSLTGVANKRQFNVSLQREWTRARRAGEPLALLSIAMDHFRSFNEHYGHRKGGGCLNQLARTLEAASLRPGDIVARYCDEQFVLLLPQTARRGAHHVAQRILQAVEALAIPHDGSPTAGHVTVSIGIACYDEVSANWVSAATARRGLAEVAGRCTAGDLVLAAEKALQTAQSAGRAQASLLDLADFDSPLLARPVALAARVRDLNPA